MSPPAIAFISSRGVPPRSTASATFGPTDWTWVSSRNSSRSSSLAKPYRFMPSSRMIRWVWSSVSAPTAGTVRIELAETASAVADAGALDDDVVGAADEHRAAHRGDQIAALIAAPLAWQMATASASAAWSGDGGSGSDSSAPTMRWTWPFSARPDPQTACLTACGVYEYARHAVHARRPA